MIELNALLIWLIVCNVTCVILLILALRRIEQTGLRFSFAAVVLAGMLYINPLLTFWLPGLEGETLLLISRLVFTGVLLLAAAFLFFVLSFSHLLLEEYRTVRFFLFATSIVVIIGLVWTGYLPEAVVTLESGERALRHGFGHAVFVAATPLYVVYMGYVAWTGYHRTQEEVLQFQIKMVLGTGVLTACAMVITNSVLPYVLGRSVFAPVGALELMIFWSVSLYLLIHGELLLVRRTFSDLLRKPIVRDFTTLMGLRTYLYTFEQALEVNRPLDEAIRLKGPGNREFMLRVSNQGSRDVPTEMIPVGWFEGQTDELLRLRRENTRVMLELERGRQIVQGLQGAARQLPAAQEAPAEEPEDGLSPLESAERAAIVRYLVKHSYNQAKASKDLGIRPNTLIVKMRKYGIQRPPQL